MTEANWEEMFRRNMASLRRREGLNQTELAEAARKRGPSLTQPAVQKIETGVRDVRLNEAYAIAAALGSSVPEMSEPDRGEKLIVQEARRKVVEAQRRLDESETSLREAREYARSLIDFGLVEDVELVSELELLAAGA